MITLSEISKVFYTSEVQTRALAVMLLFSVFSAWYPAHKVSRVSPAEALHNE